MRRMQRHAGAHYALMIGVGAAAVAAALATGCNSLFEKAEQKISDRADDALPTQPTEETPPTQVVSRIALSAVTPARSPLAGGTPVQITGLGFVPGVRVYFGSAQAALELTEIVNETTLKTITPGRAEPGVVDVRVADDTDAGVLEGGFLYFVPVAVTALEPATGPTVGGTQITVHGAGFIEGTEVQFGSADAGRVDAVMVDGGTLVATTPPLPLSRFAVTVSNTNGAATLPAAFTTYEPVRIDSIEPFAGPAAGGTELVVRGAGLVAGSRLFLGAELVATSPGDDSRGQSLAATIPQAEPARPEGAVVVRVENDNGAAERRPGFVFVDTETPGPRVVAMAPGAGSVDGGTPVAVAVAGFAGAPQWAYVDGEPLIDCAAQNARVLLCRTPPHAAGAAAVLVAGDNGETAVLPGGFTYVEIKLTAVTPAEGAIAGGTYVTLTGSGFAPDTRVFLGAAAATVVVVVADSTGTALTLRSPPAGRAGRVPITIETMGVRAVFDEAFTYFDPVATANFTDGGPISGAINVTVIDASDSARVPGAYVIASDDPTTAAAHHWGITDARGQITLSGPDLLGPQSVHAGKSGYGAFSWIDVNARNMVLMLDPHPAPPPEPLPDCPQGQGAAPAVLRGRVDRIKDRYNLGTDPVMVTTTYVDLSTPLPPPGAKAVVRGQGDYELVARAGDMVVIARAGEFTFDNDFAVHAMGFRPFVFAEAGSGAPCQADGDCSNAERCYDGGEAPLCTHIYDDVDIVIDTPVGQIMAIELDDPPYLTAGEGSFVTAPDLGVASVWYDFGYMGLWPMGNASGHNATTLAMTMPRALPTSLGLVPFSVSGGVYMQVEGGTYPPQSETYAHNLLDTRQSVRLTPLLQTHDRMSIAAPSNGPMDVSFKFRPAREGGAGAAGPTAVVPTANFHAFFSVESFKPCAQAMPMPRTVVQWLVLTAGTNESFSLPRFPSIAADANPGTGRVYWQLMSMFTPGASIHRAELGSLFDWKSQSLGMSWYSAP